MQAGQSARGKAFGSRWAEVVFALFRTIERGREIRTELRDRATANGRDPESIKIVTAAYVIVGETETIAQEKLALIESLADPVDKVTLLSELLNFDFSRPSLDQVMTDDDLDQISGSRGLAENIIEGGDRYPTFGEFIENSARGTVHELPKFVGTPRQIADDMEEWFTGEACDGFMVAATHIPGSYEDFVRLVVPELQRRGLAQTEYNGGTLRDHLGLARPPSAGGP
jgi:alkanesulfonate monooxygenase SsuD/methylene tetrahydromethanopterin reductase-like flavin-dependent oxidoreductase (luciferase family)